MLLALAVLATDTQPDARCRCVCSLPAQRLRLPSCAHLICVPPFPPADLLPFDETKQEDLKKAIVASLHVANSYGPDDVILKVVSVNQSPAQGGGGRKMMAEVSGRLAAQCVPWVDRAICYLWLGLPALISNSFAIHCAQAGNGVWAGVACAAGRAR